jgi:CheY-like chemotaxis protein
MTLTTATVLLVDDEPDLLEIFGNWLGRSGYRVFTAPNGAEALKVLAVEAVDVLISDIRMPIMDGPTLVRSIRERGLMIPSIIFVSGFGDVDLREMHALGVEAMIEKPLNREALLAAITASLLAREELWREPLSGQIKRHVSVDLTGADSAVRAQQFALGRGGCCFPYSQPLSRGQIIDLTILLDGGHNLKAHAEVRWYSPEQALAGVAFRYLAPESRGWVTGAISSRMPRSFIPRGTPSVQDAVKFKHRTDAGIVPAAIT